MSRFGNVLRGGQIQIHQFRMAKQILGVAFFIAIFIGILGFSYQYYKIKEKFDYYAITTYAKSHVIIAIVPLKYAASMKVRYGNGSLEASPYSFIADPFIKYKFVTFQKKLKALTLKSMGISLFSFILIIILWLRLGNIRDVNSNQKGVYPADQVRKYLAKNKILSDISLGNLPLVKNKETSHILLAGANGTGKTSAILALVEQIRAKNHNAIIVDLTGQYTDLFYNPKIDYILNPLDARSAYWDLWKEGNCREKLTTISSALFVGDAQSHDKFWSESAKIIFEEAVQYIASSNSSGKYKALYNLLAVDDLDILAKKLKNTAAGNLINPKNEKTALSIRSVVVTYCRIIEYLASMKIKEEKFSIENWMNRVDTDKNGSWLFLSASPKQRKVMEPLIRMWMDIALASLMNLPSDLDRRVWLIMDEMPALGRLPTLPSILSEARKYGGCLISGIQSISQLYETYGHHGANIIIDNYATKVFFRVTGPENTSKIARIFGQNEQEEINENVTYGAHEMRDGVSISRHNKSKLIVSEKDLIQLKDLEAYALLPCELDIVKVKFDLFRK